MNASIIGRRRLGKKFGIAAVLAIGLGTFSLQSASALPLSDTVYTTYYKDASKTTVVGERIFTCSGRVIKFGKASPYYDMYSEPC